MDLMALDTTKYLLSKNSKIFTIESDELVETILQEPLAKTDFEELGFDELDLLLDRDLNNTALLINTSTEEPLNKLGIIAIPNSQLVLSKADILLRMANRIDNFQIYSNQTIPENIKIIFSVDSGIVWQTFDDDLAQFKEIESIEDLEEVKLEGMTVSTFNSIGLKWDDVIKDGRIKFGYYLEVDEIANVVKIDKLEVNIEISGRWKKAKKKRDYEYEYINEKLIVNLYGDGGYKINYAE